MSQTKYCTILEMVAVVTRKLCGIVVVESKAQEPIRIPVLLAQMLTYTLMADHSSFGGQHYSMYPTCVKI